MHSAFMRVGWCLCFVLGALFFSELKAADHLDSPEYSNQKIFAISLFEEKDYYRTISEVYRIKFQYSTKLDLDLEFILLQSFFHLKQYHKVFDHSKLLLQKEEVRLDSYNLYWVGTALASSLIETGDVKQASDVWNKYGFPYEGETFPDEQSFPKPVDPKKAKLFSAFLPGSGLLFSREYGKAAVSFLLNAVFIAGIYHYGSDEQYGIAGLLTFFELGWYFGGQNAAYESAEKYNRKHILEEQKAWIAKKHVKPGWFKN